MSVSFNCHCAERRKPIQERNWEVWQRLCNYSYFEKPRGSRHLSIYSTVYCKSCQALGRTKAKYVNSIPDKEK